MNSGDEADIRFASFLMESIGETLRSVPTFMYCESSIVGFNSANTTGALIEAELEACHDRIQSQIDAAAEADAPPALQPPPDEEGPIELPIIGYIDPNKVSLPAFTIAVAGLDAFNPCAFFMLLFLLSLLVHAKSRGRMALIGGTFVLVSGILYFAFMVAWLNVFLLFGALPAVTIVAGSVAVVIATVNIKDYFWFQQGVSLSIPEEAKPGLFKRMRTLTTASSLPLILAGTIALAVAANSYELLCTAGFPLVFTRVLTLNDLPTLSYYSYLLLYNVVYVVPLLVIVAVFVWTLGSRKLSEKGGRTLKLVSGLMMLGLGLVLLLANELLENMLTAPLILVTALLVTSIIVLVDRFRSRPPSRPTTPDTA